MAEEKGTQLDTFMRFVMGLANALSLVAITAAGSLLWTIKADLQETKGDVKYMLGQVPRIDRVVEAGQELRERMSRAEERIEQLKLRVDGQREFIVQVVKGHRDLDMEEKR